METFYKLAIKYSLYTTEICEENTLVNRQENSARSSLSFIAQLLDETTLSPWRT